MTPLGFNWASTKRRLAGTFRVTVYMSVAFGVLGAISARRLHAEVREAAGGLGRTLEHIESFTRERETMLVNGLVVHRASTFSKKSVHEVLDKYEAHCHDHPNAFMAALADLPGPVLRDFEKATSDEALRGGTYRFESESQGSLVCFAAEKRGGLEGLRKSLEALASTGSLEQFGKFRYVTVRRAAGGETHVATLWSDDDLNLLKMFPAQGDAEGTDPGDVPRPPNARRHITAAIEGSPFGIWAYASKEPKKDLMDFYRREMERLGWKPSESGDPEASLSFLRDQGRQVIVSFLEAEGGPMVTIAETGVLRTVQAEGEP